MATSAFKSTTKRATIGGSSSEDSGRRSLRRSRSLSRFSRPVAPEQETDNDYNKNVPRGKFVNTTRGSTAPFPEISLDDLALELFSSSSRNESDGGVVERNEREGRSVSRRGEIGRWASDTASSRIRGRSASRSRGDAVPSSSASGAKKVVSSEGGSRRRRSLSVARTRGDDVSSSSALGANSAISSDAGSRRRRSLSVARTRGDAVSSSSAVGANIAISSDAGSRRRRSLSVASFQISDSESEVDHSRNLSGRATMKAPIRGNIQTLPASNNRRLGRPRSNKDLSLINDGYSSHSSALTDDESKDAPGRNGFEKIIKAVYAQKKAMGRNQTALDTSDCLLSENPKDLQVFSGIREKYAQKLEQLEKRKKDLLTEMLLEEHGQEVSQRYEELPNSRTSAVPEKPSRPRKRSSDRSRVSEKLIEDAERYFEDFIFNIEDTDISSFDGERSDGSSTLGGTVKARDSVIREAETCKTPAGSTPRPVEMDGVILPWLQWETSHDGSVSGKNEARTPLTPKALHRNSEKEPSSLSISSHGSWSPHSFSRDEASPQVGNDSYEPQNSEELLLFEMYRERNRISSGGLLLCTACLY